MKSFLRLAMVLPLLSAGLWGQVFTNASVLTDGTPFDGGGVVAPDPVILVLSGTADAGVSRTENTLWQPDGSPDVLGDLGLGAHTYVPHGGPGIYWLQFRLIDANDNYQDQWISFTVSSGYLLTNASATVANSSVTLTQDGQASNGVAWTENVVWRPDGGVDVLGQLAFGQIAYAPTAGAGQYWYQFRLVDSAYNFRDQWISFVVP